MVHDTVIKSKCAGAAAAWLQWIASSFRGGEKRLSGSAGLCICRPCSACYFLEVIRPTLPHQEKALMISGSHEICTACRSRLHRFVEPRFASLSPPSILFSQPLSLLNAFFFLPPFIVVQCRPLLFILYCFSFPIAQQNPRLSALITLISLSSYLLCSLSLSSVPSFSFKIKSVRSPWTETERAFVWEWHK